MFVLSLIAKTGAPLMIVDYACHVLQRRQRGLIINYPANHTDAMSKHFYCLQNSSIRANRSSKSL